MCIKNKKGRDEIGIYLIYIYISVYVAVLKMCIVGV